MPVEDNPADHERAGITDLGSDVFAIDTRMSGYSGITASYLIRGDRPCLVETGTATSAPVVTRALRSLGVGPQDLATVVVTHVHLDHAGGAGDLADAFPRARVAAHENGVRHLASPERLLASARRVFGTVLDEVFGLLRPVPPERISALSDEDSIDLGGGRRLSAFFAPGHAQHHVGLLDSDSGDLYVGDAAGIYIPDTGDLRPATPPPDFDLPVALDTLTRFRAEEPARLLFSHFGPVEDPGATLERAAEELRVWTDEVARARGAAPDVEHVIELVQERTAERYRAYLADAELVEKFEHLNATASNVAGINRWLDRREKQNAAS